MKNKAKLAFEMLEQEMEVIYNEDLIQFTRGSGGYTWQKFVNDIQNGNFSNVPAGSYLMNNDGSTTIYGGMLNEVVSGKLKKHVLKQCKEHVFMCFFIIFDKKKMNTKLTLTIEQDVISKAKKYAKEKNRSLSNIIENYLKSLTKEEAKTEVKLSPLVKSLKGSFKMPADFDYKKELRKGLEEKYL